MFTFGLAGGGHGFDPLILLLMALAVEAAVGDPGFIFRVVRHPVAVIGAAVDWFDRKLNREQRSDMDRAIRGAVVVAIIVVATGAIGWGIAWLTRNHDFGVIIEFILLITLLAQRGLYDHVKAVATALNDEGVEAGRAAVAHVVGRDPSRLDDHGVARAALESLAENFADGVVAPVFWYILFGFPGLLIYKAVNTMDSMIGYRTPRHRAFGFTAARLDDILNLIPARLAALYLALAACFASMARPFESLRAMLRDAGKHRSPNAGWPESAMAGALGLALAGPRQYAHGVVKDAWMGTGTAQAVPRDIRRGLDLYLIACLINAAIVGALVIIRLTMETA
jgi:adenosylcobinamide-phosphate synthase